MLYEKTVQNYLAFFELDLKVNRRTLLRQLPNARRMRRVLRYFPVSGTITIGPWP